jgi:hypothetical protein
VTAASVGESQTCGKERTIRGALLRWLLTDVDALECVHVNGIEFTGARFEGDVNLGGTLLDFVVWLQRCELDAIHLEDAKTRTLILEDCECASIAADRLAVDGSLHIDKTRVGGGVTLTAASVTGSLDLQSSRLSGGKEYALTCSRVTVGGAVYLQRAEIHGAATFVNARIGWDLNAAGLETHTYLRVNRASIGGRLDLSGARLGTSTQAVTDPDERPGLQAAGVKIGGALVWKGVTLSDAGEVSLSDADVATLDDDADAWPAAGKLKIDGLSYGSLAGIPSDHREFATWRKARIAWIRKQTEDDYSPQPYGELIAALRAEGNDSAAIDVAVDREKDRRRYAGLDIRQKVQLWLLSAVGYGYRPSRALIGVVLFVAIGWALFSIGHDDGYVVRADNNSKARFVAAVYSLDTFVPVIDLGLEKQFTVTGQKGFGVWLQRYYWLHVAAGWLITTLVVLGLTGVVRKE